ncbi:COG1470 family protein [Winogradskya humida]|uniref:Hydrolase n=1 Tax=Winogradskya humida TaxID=113566 RepID=A0ABQ3ZP19_9ACTN|nr:hypothetical protein [Actinoplanes humidus]GIE20319.1 hypothetical protein Ahu01nite_034210 [Actinoplanes humidus]
MSLWTLLEPASIAVDPGSSGTATLRLRNDGDTVEEYQLAVVGAPAAWARIEPAVVRLFPGTRGQAEVTFRPPRAPEALAGLTAYGISVRSRQNPAVFDVAEGSVTVSAFGDVRAELFPLTVKGRLAGRPGLTVRNLSNAPLTAVVQARDDEDVLTFRPWPQVLQVPPGGTATSEVKISPRGIRLLRGDSRHTYAATVVPSVAGATGLPDRLETRGTFVRRPVMPRFLLFALVLLVVLVGLGAGVYYGAGLNTNG